MRKSLLLFTLLAMAAPGFATTRDRGTRPDAGSLPAVRLQSPTRADAEGPIMNVEGEITRYAAHLYWIHEGTAFYDEGILTSLCRPSDGTTVYLNQLMPAWQEGWLKGTVAEDGSLHFPSGQLVSRWGIGNIYISAAVKNPRSGELEPTDEFVLAPLQDGYYLAQNGNDNVYIFSYAEDGTILEIDYQLELTPFSDREAEPPEGAEEKRYERTYFDNISKYPYTNEVTVASVGNDLWLEGFNGHLSGYVKGTLEADGSILIPTGQYVGQSGQYASYLFCFTNDPTNGTQSAEAMRLAPSGKGWKSEQNSHLGYGYSEDQIEFVNKNFTLMPVGSGIADAVVGAEAVGTDVYDLSGRRVVRPEKGLYIRVTTYSDGTRRAEKVNY